MSLRYPLLCLVANGANLMDAESERFGEKLAFRGTGFGPCMAQESLIVEVTGTND